MNGKPTNRIRDKVNPSKGTYFSTIPMLVYQYKTTGIYLFLTNGTQYVALFKKQHRVLRQNFSTFQIYYKTMFKCHRTGLFLLKIKCSVSSTFMLDLCCQILLSKERFVNPRLQRLPIKYHLTPTRAISGKVCYI